MRSKNFDVNVAVKKCTEVEAQAKNYENKVRYEIISKIPLRE